MSSEGRHVHVNEDQYRGGIRHVTKLALQEAYPNWAKNGYQEFVEKPPVVYVSPALHFNVAAMFASEVDFYYDMSDDTNITVKYFDSSCRKHTRH